MRGAVHAGFGVRPGGRARWHTHSARRAGVGWADNCCTRHRRLTNLPALGRAPRCAPHARAHRAVQGFFFHMLRVRHQVGVDINQMPELPLDAWPRVAGRDGPPEHRYRLGHFFNKPFARSVPRPPCRQYVKRRKPDKVKHQLAKQLAWNIEASAALAATNDDAVVAADVRARCLRAWNGTRMCIRLLIHGHGIEPSFIEKHATLDSLYHPREMLAGPRQPAGLRRRPNGAARHPALQGGQHR